MGSLSGHRFAWPILGLLITAVSVSAAVWMLFNGAGEADTASHGVTSSPPRLIAAPPSADEGVSPPSSDRSVGTDGHFLVPAADAVVHRFEVDSQTVHVTTQWPDGDVVLSLTSPSGRVIDRDTIAADVRHEVGPTYESYHVHSPEQGAWTAKLYGAKVAPKGEETRLDIYQAPRANRPPIARVEQNFAGRTVTVDGSSSSDSDGSIERYLWEFGDGATAGGPTASHTYTEPGTYLVTLAVQDNQGRWDVTSAPTTVDVR
jgi:hypothetical protein